MDTSSRSVCMDLDTVVEPSRGRISYRDAVTAHMANSIQGGDTFYNRLRNEYYKNRYIKYYEKPGASDNMLRVLLSVLLCFTCVRAATNWCNCVDKDNIVSTVRLSHADALKPYKINRDARLNDLFVQRGKKYGYTEIDVDDVCATYYVPPGAPDPPEGNATTTNSALVQGIIRTLRESVRDERPLSYKEWYDNNASKYENWRPRDESIEALIETAPVVDKYHEHTPAETSPSLDMGSFKIRVVTDSDNNPITIIRQGGVETKIIQVGSRTAVLTDTGGKLVTYDLNGPQASADKAEFTSEGSRETGHLPHTKGIIFPSELRTDDHELVLKDENLRLQAAKSGLISIHSYLQNTLDTEQALTATERKELARLIEQVRLSINASNTEADVLNTMKLINDDIAGRSLKHSDAPRKEDNILTATRRAVQNAVSLFPIIRGPAIGGNFTMRFGSL